MRRLQKRSVYRLHDPVELAEQLISVGLYREGYHGASLRY
jgi:hypothetical protein